MKIIAITQARYGSTRLPAKVLKKVGEKSLLEIHIERIILSKKISKLIVATTKENGAQKIIDIASKKKVDVFQGDTDDVLNRFYYAALPHKPDYVVRLTSDCPLIDPIIIDKIIDTCLENNYDYVSNTMNPTFPDGIDVEVFRFKALKTAFSEAKLKSDREHVTPYIWRNSTFKGETLFKSFSFENSKDLSDYRMTVDTESDFEVIKALINDLGPDQKWNEYIDYLDSHNEVKELNQHHKRNEGYQKSLLNDK